jgi:hypothetical protein
LETVAVDTPAAFATSRIVRAIEERFSPKLFEGEGTLDWEKKHLQYRLRKMLDKIQRFVR